MGMDITGGEYFRGYLQSSTLAADTAIPLFDADGNARTLKAGERLVIYELLVSMGGTAGFVTVYCDTDGSGTLNAGEELASFNLAVGGQGALPSASGAIMGRRSDGANKNKLRAVASANSAITAITVVGHIIKS